jgi:hypothetical protein
MNRAEEHHWYVETILWTEKQLDDYLSFTGFAPPTRRNADGMPLTPDAGILPSKFNGVYFVMFNGAERVLCLADYAALQDLGARHKMTEDFLAVFHAFRHEIEKRASAKFDACDRDVNGNVVLIGADLNF